MGSDLAPIYDRRAELEYAAPPGLDLDIARKFERIAGVLLSHTPCESFLDAGSGDGRYLALMGGRADRLVGVDLSERILQTAAETLEEAGVSVELLVADLEQLPFDSESFDLVLCSQVIEHLLDPAAGIRELARVMRPGGTLVISTDNTRNAITRALNAPRDLLVWLLRQRERRRSVAFPHRSFRVEEFVGLIRCEGLLIDHVETFRFHLRSPLDESRLQRQLNRLDRALPETRLGDIILIVARAP